MRFHGWTVKFQKRMSLLAVIIQDFVIFATMNLGDMHS